MLHQIGFLIVPIAYRRILIVLFLFIQVRFKVLSLHLLFLITVSLTLNQNTYPNTMRQQQKVSLVFYGDDVNRSKQHIEKNFSMLDSEYFKVGMEFNSEKICNSPI